MECKIKDITINYEVIGSGKPIIMLHGYYVDHRIMLGCMETVFSEKDGYKRIYLDLPGMGKSSSAKWANNSDAMVDIIIAFIEEILPKENFLIAGQSYGGYLTRGVMNKMSDRIDGAVLICPVIIPENDKRDVPEHVVIIEDKAFLATLTTEEAEDFSGALVVQSEKIYNRHKNEIMTGIAMADDVFLQDLRKNGYACSYDVDKLEKKFDKPVLFILGKQDDCVGYKDAWSILDNYPRATFAVLDVAGHALQLEQEELFKVLVRDLLVRAK